MTPNISSWRVINLHNKSVRRNWKFTVEKQIEPGKAETNAAGQNSDRVKLVDQELARIREAPVQIIDESCRCVIRMEMGRFTRDAIKIAFEPDKIIVLAEEEVKLTQTTSIIMRIVKRVLVDVTLLRTDVMASHLDLFGNFSLTFLKKRL